MLENSELKTSNFDVYLKQHITGLQK